VVVLLAGAASTAAYAAYTASSKNTANTLASGTVSLTDDDAGGTIVSLSAADGGDASTGCIEVHYTGTLPAAVRLTGTASGPLAAELDLTVTRGTGVAGFPGCGSFAADATNYLGSGAGVVYSGKLSAFPTTWAAGVLDPPGATQETWTQNEKHVYRFRVSVPADGGAQGLGPATAQFAWEARNL
jgi:hypothetical protein